MTIGAFVRERESPHDDYRDPVVELINRGEQSPLKWNLDKFSVLMLPTSMGALSLRPLKGERRPQAGRGQTHARDRPLSPPLETVHRNRRTCYHGETVAGTSANYHAGDFEVSRLRRRPRSS